MARRTTKTTKKDAAPAANAAEAKTTGATTAPAAATPAGADADGGPQGVSAAAGGAAAATPPANPPETTGPAAVVADAAAKAAIEAAAANDKGQTGVTHQAVDQPGAPAVVAALTQPPATEPPARPDLGEQAVLISGPAKGRWRSVGGKAVRFGREPTPVRVADLTEEEVAAIKRDPKLSVTAAPNNA
jgi:ribonuclease E